MLTVAFAIVTNTVVQVARKPTELLFPLSTAWLKSPAQTWDAYGYLFREHATARIPADLLGALAQVEASGNPVARTYWRFSWPARPFDVYRPASSAVGLYQFTDGTFELARRYCIHDHVVVEDGPWNDFRSCWFNGLYTRTVPGHAVELMSAYLDRATGGILARQHVRAATARQQQQLAAVIHLCGAGAGEIFARRRFRLTGGQRCGDHSVATYVGRVERFQSEFRRLAAADQRASSSSSSASRS